MRGQLDERRPSLVAQGKQSCNEVIRGPFAVLKPSEVGDELRKFCAKLKPYRHGIGPFLHLFRGVDFVVGGIEFDGSKLLGIRRWEGSSGGFGGVGLSDPFRDVPRRATYKGCARMGGPGGSDVRGGKREIRRTQSFQVGEFAELHDDCKLNPCMNEPDLKTFGVFINLRSMKDWHRMLAPRYCVGCGHWLVTQTDWPVACDVCSATWPDLRSREGSMLMRERCGSEYVWTGFRLRTSPELNSQVNAFKYGGDRLLAARWGAWLGRSHPFPAELEVGRTALVPVPLHWKKWLRRGYNQSLWLAYGVAREWKVSVWPRALMRTRHMGSLTGLSRTSRAAVSQSLYSTTEQWHSSTQPPPAIILVDDVMTTGATTLACGRALERAGLRWRGTMTLALA